MFLLWGEGRGEGEWILSTLFSMCSHHDIIRFSLSLKRVPQVPKLSLKTFPIAPQIYPIWWFAQSSTLMPMNMAPLEIKKKLKSIVSALMNMSHNVRCSNDPLPLQAQNVHKSLGSQSTTCNNIYAGTNVGTYRSTFPGWPLRCSLIILIFNS